MNSVETGIPLNTLNIKALDMSKLKAFKISEAPDDVYKNMVDAQEKILEARHTHHSNTSNDPAYKPYATVEVNGKVVAKVDNHGFIETSNALGGKVHKLFSNTEQGLNGPELAQQRAEKIAGLLGGTVVKSSSALTQTQFTAVSLKQPTLDYQAIKEDRSYQSLQKTKEARTLFLAQRFAQEERA